MPQNNKDPTKMIFQHFNGEQNFNCLEYTARIDMYRVRCVFTYHSNRYCIVYISQGIVTLISVIVSLGIHNAHPREHFELWEIIFC